LITRRPKLLNTSSLGHGGVSGKCVRSHVVLCIQIHSFYCISSCYIYHLHSPAQQPGKLSSNRVATWLKQLQHSRIALSHVTQAYEKIGDCLQSKALALPPASAARNEHSTFKRQKAKGPNPLSVKKSAKKDGQMLGDLNHTSTSGGVKKRARRKKPWTGSTQAQGAGQAV
jgi:hypothetical protein